MFLKKTSYTLSTMFIHRYIFEFMTKYGDIAQTASLQMKLFLYMLHQCDKFDCINAKYIIVLLQIPPGESTLYVLSHEVYLFLPIYCFLWLTYAYLSSPNWLNCYSINSWARFNSNDLSIILADVTDVSLFNKRVRFFKCSLSDW